MSVRPEDFMPDDKNIEDIGGREIRKGTMGAFLSNIDIIENFNSTKAEKAEAIKMLKTLAPDMISSSVHKHVIFKNEKVEAILNKADIKNED